MKTMKKQMIIRISQINCSHKWKIETISERIADLEQESYILKEKINKKMVSLTFPSRVVACFDLKFEPVGTLFLCISFNKRVQAMLMCHYIIILVRVL